MAGLNFQYSRRIVVMDTTAMAGNKTETYFSQNYLKHKIIGRDKRITARENSIPTGQFHYSRSIVVMDTIL